MALILMISKSTWSLEVLGFQGKLLNLALSQLDGDLYKKEIKSNNIMKLFTSVRSIYQILSCGDM